MPWGWGVPRVHPVWDGGYGVSVMERELPRGTFLFIILYIFARLARPGMLLPSEIQVSFVSYLIILLSLPRSYDSPC